MGNLNKCFILGLCFAIAACGQSFKDKSVNLSSQSQTPPSLPTPAPNPGSGLNSTSTEEFVGPFANWSNIKTTYGAKGDGVTDDTAAIQKALTELGQSNSSVLYFPAGTYHIRSTLNILMKLSVNIVGEDPATTKIVWAGATGGTMIYINGFTYSRFDRFTFEGSGTAGVIIDQSWDNSPGSFDTGNQYADNTFQNAAIGFRCGNLGYGCAETSILRNKFFNHTEAAIILKNFNALDMFIWHSTFKNNAVGVTNSPGAGNFHIYSSYFEASTTADIMFHNTGTFNFRGNYSIGSNAFIDDQQGGTNNPAQVNIQGNTILDTTSTQAITINDLGPVVLIDNIFRSKAGVTNGAVVAVAAFNPSDLFSMGNTFTVDNPLYSNGKVVSISDLKVARSTIQPQAPVLPTTPINYNRLIFEVPAGASIQQAIDQAVASSDENPIVHIQEGNHAVNATLVVPANRKIQIFGDGQNSAIYYSGIDSNPVLQLEGPSHAIVSELSFFGKNQTSDGIVVTGADQNGSRVFFQQGHLAGSKTNLLVDQLDYTNIEAHNINHGDSANLAGFASIKVIGGAHASQGNWLGGKTSMFAGSSSGSYLAYDVSNGAHVNIRDIWYDNGSGGEQGATISGKSYFTFSGATMYLNDNAAAPAISFNNFQGVAALLNLTFSSQKVIGVSGNNTGGRILGLSIIGPNPGAIANTASTSPTIGILNSAQNGTPPDGAATAQIADQGTVDSGFILATLNQMRTDTPSQVGLTQSGITDVRFYRVNVGNCLTGITLKN